MSDVQPTNSTADWSAKATETVVQSVDKVKEKTTGKALDISRVAVYGVAMAFIAVLLLLLLLVLLVRMANVALEELVDRDRAVWITYLVFAVIFWIGGMVLWRKRGS